MIRALAAAVLALAAAVPAAAQDTGEWRVTVQPYVWATGVSGTIRPTAAAPTFAFSQSIGESLSTVDGAFSAAVSAQRDRFVILGDFSTVSTSRRGTVPPGLPAHAATSTTTFTLAAGWQVHAEPSAAVDVFAGIRAFWLGARVEVPPGAPVAERSLAFVDPIVGARAVTRLAPQWSAMLHADVGGFGVGSRLTVVASGIVNYHVNANLTLSGGIRVMALSYDDGNTRADVTLAGPILGVSWRF
jgi:hypothetical protein